MGLVLSVLYNSLLGFIGIWNLFGLEVIICFFVVDGFV